MKILFSFFRHHTRTNQVFIPTDALLGFNSFILAEVGFLL